jgi:transposase
MAKFRRSWSPELKSKAVLELISGTSTLAQVARKYRVTEQLLTSWRKLFLERLPTLFGAEVAGDHARTQHIAELERTLGRKTLEIELLKKASTWLIGPSTSNVNSS